MHAGRRFAFREVVLWTRRDILWFLLLATVPTVLFQVVGL